MVSCNKMVSYELGHKPVNKNHQKAANRIERNSLNTFNWTIAKLDHKLMVNHKLQSCVTPLSHASETRRLGVFMLFLLIWMGTSTIYIV